MVVMMHMISMAISTLIISINVLSILCLLFKADFVFSRLLQQLVDVNRMYGDVLRKTIEEKKTHLENMQ